MDDLKPKRKRGRPSEKQELDLNFVLEKAVRIFAANGFQGTRLKDIADASGISKSLINYHFLNKESIWKQAIQKTVEKLVERLNLSEDYFREHKGVGALKELVVQYVYFSADYPFFYKLVFQEMCSKSERSRWMVEQLLRPIHKRVEVFFHLDHKNTAEVPLEQYVYLLVGATNAYFVHAFEIELLYGVNPFEKKSVEKHAHFVSELVVEGLLRWSQRDE